ncbi:hypothetical protein [Microbulbifer sp. TYP-18]|uniref:hypothetical protein n=1 Tax=Microbulbifer sp. TYP-18 TaxID=3230024 RepID=UPI0034C6C5E9
MRSRYFTVFLLVFFSARAMSAVTLSNPSITVEQLLSSEPEHVKILASATAVSNNLIPQITATFGYDFTCPTIQSGTLRAKRTYGTETSWSLVMNFSKSNQDIVGYPTWTGSSATCLLNYNWTAMNRYALSATVGVGAGFSVDLPDHEYGDNTNVSVVRHSDHACPVNPCGGNTGIICP